MQEVTQRLAPKVKRFYKFKGILNLVFEYATDPEHCYIAVNPVPKENLPYLKNCTYSSRKPEDKAFQPDEVKKIREYLWKRVESRKYDVNGYAILFASESGCREAELPALKWEDVLETDIHIHAQQNDQEVDGEKCYYYNPTTKNEKGVSHDGRLVPMTDGIRKVLTSLREKQESLGIVSEWVFCKEDGTWITTAGYSEALYRLCKETLGLKRTNNHAFRIALNSYEFIPAGLDVATRAKILGHSVEVNLRDYTFEKKDYITEAT
jgi:integrase